MAHRSRFTSRMAVVKTPKGYVSKYGFTEDVTSKEVLAIRTGKIGGRWAKKQERLIRFRSYFHIFMPFKDEECEFFTYDPSDERRSELSEWK